jgi:hypothetical protein
MMIGERNDWDLHRRPYHADDHTVGQFYLSLYEDFNDPDMLVVGLDGMSPFGVVKDCPTHVTDCVPGTYISRERWGVVSLSL